MKSRRSGFIIVFMLFIALFYCHFMVSIYTEKIYTQQNLLFYHLLTPKPLKQGSEIIFTGIQKSGIQIAEDKLNAYIETYPVSRETMSIVVEEKYKKYDIKVIHYESNE
nr:hypothetical protein [Citrobacter freundii]